MAMNLKIILNISHPVINFNNYFSVTKVDILL